MKKVEKLSPDLKSKIIIGEKSFIPNPQTPVTNYLVHTKRHCNGGKTVDAGLWLKDHLNNGGKLFLTMAGAGSSFQMGITISELIRAGKVHAISVTGANMEESMYRYVAHSHYAYIPNYTDLTPAEENELREAGLRRITDTFLPEDESVRMILPELEKLWREAEAKGERHFWHEYFFMLFEKGLVQKDPEAKEEDCWLYQAWKYKIPVYVPGFEDSTMGNIFTQACYDGNDELLAKYKFPGGPINPKIVQSGIDYMHHLAEWYVNNTKDSSIAFLQLGGGIAADFPICVVPHLKHDYLADETTETKDKIIAPWAAFIEIHSSPMSFGSYSGAGWKEKITWDKLPTNPFGLQIFGDYTEHCPDIAAIILEK